MEAQIRRNDPLRAEGFFERSEFDAERRVKEAADFERTKSPSPSSEEEEGEIAEEKLPRKSKKRSR